MTITTPLSFGLTPCRGYRWSFKIRVISLHRRIVKELFEPAVELEVEALEALKHFMLEAVILFGLPICRALNLLRDRIHLPREVNFELFEALLSI